MGCGEFCMKQIEVKGKLTAEIKHSGPAISNPFIAGRQDCPIGFTCNPKTPKATAHAIAAGNRFEICTANPWKYMSDKDVKAYCL